MDQDCIFCKIVAGSIPAKIIDRNDLVMAFMSLQNHPLIIPIKHFENIYTLDDQTAAALMQETVKVAQAIKTQLKADGLNIVQNNEIAGGQDVMHFHIHLKPRFKNDGLSNPMLGSDTKIELAFEKLKTALSHDLA